MHSTGVTEPEDYVRGRIARTKPSMGWQPGDQKQRETWQTALRAKIAALLGGLPWERCPLNAHVIETVDLPSYRRESVLLDTREGLTAFGYFLTPLPTSDAPKAAILCLHGHGYGADAISGIGENGDLLPDDSPKLGDHYALQCVQHGYPTFALEQISFGRRADKSARDSYPGTSSCSRDSMAALMLSETMIGWRVWDAMRAIDYMEMRPEVDPHRIGIMGLSGGGTTSLFASCIDTRIAATVISGYYDTFADSILAMDHCVDNYVPGLLDVTEMPDLAGLIAPRPFFAEGGLRDPIYPVEGLRKAIDRAKLIFDGFGVPDHFGYEIFEGSHQFHGVNAFEFLSAQL